jgi:hypothetical protein
MNVGVQLGIDVHPRYSGTVECQVVEISETIDKATGDVIEQYSTHIQSGQICRVVLVPLEP